NRRFGHCALVESGQVHEARGDQRTSSDDHNVLRLREAGLLTTKHRRNRTNDEITTLFVIFSMRILVLLIFALVIGVAAKDSPTNEELTRWVKDGTLSKSAEIKDSA